MKNTTKNFKTFFYQNIDSSKGGDGFVDNFMDDLFIAQIASHDDNVRFLGSGGQNFLLGGLNFLIS